MRSAPLPSTIDVRRGAERYRTTTALLDSRHSFSFGRHYNPGNVGYGALVVHNDDLVLPGEPAGPHQHRDMEIVTWVVQGSLVHEDDAGRRSRLTPGVVHRLSAGAGVMHTETAEQPARVIRMWVPPDVTGTEASYGHEDVSGDLAAGGLVRVAGRDAAVTLGRGATLHVGRLDVGERVALPEAAHLHVFVARGAVTVEDIGPIGGRLEDGDALRLTAAGGLRVSAIEPAEILVWDM